MFEAGVRGVIYTSMKFCLKSMILLDNLNEKQLQEIYTVFCSLFENNN
jgi:uncharacterized protein (UPF0332 family)